MAPVLKTGIPERVSGVRIPPSPPGLPPGPSAALGISARGSDAAQTPQVQSLPLRHFPGHSAVDEPRPNSKSLGVLSQETRVSSPNSLANLCRRFMKAPAFAKSAQGRATGRAGPRSHGPKKRPPKRASSRDLASETLSISISSQSRPMCLGRSSRLRPSSSDWALWPSSGPYESQISFAPLEFPPIFVLNFYPVA